VCRAPTDKSNVKRSVTWIYPKGVIIPKLQNLDQMPATLSTVTLLLLTGKAPACMNLRSYYLWAETLFVCLLWPTEFISQSSNELIVLPDGYSVKENNEARLIRKADRVRNDSPSTA